MTRRPLLQHRETPAVFRLNPLAASVRAAVTGSMLLAIASPAAAELPVPSAVWASMGGATREVVGNTMNINQETDRVILNWDRFNVSADSTVNFHQKTTDIALNKIHDQNPSEILGTVNADGTIYLVNTNGIVFGENSQVNARALVASTMNVGFEDTFDTEQINNVALTDDRAAFVGNGQVFEKDGNGNFKLDANGHKIPIRIHIKQGAHIKSKEGGRIMVLAPNILNEGNVESPGGQVIMAAATDKVYLANASEEDGVRGLLVEVKTGGKVENIGKIAAERGNVTLMGFAVNQNGRVSATTATNVNGSIRLLAREGGRVETLPGNVKRIISSNTTRTVDNGDGLGTSAQVVLGEGSTTEVLPDNNSASALDAEVQPLSKVEVMAHKVNLKNGSSIVAPGGEVDITATRNPANPVADNSIRNDSRILVDAGAKIDVSGVDTTVRTMESNVIDVELRNFQLADAPLQKNGVLKGETIKVDIREGTPLTDIKPSLNAIQRSVGERLSEGGTIALKSEGDVIVEQGAVLDISGGKVTFLDGIIETTKLLAGGRVIDISQADPLQTYDGIYGEVKVNYKKWGQTFTYKIQGGVFGQGRFEKGYVDGKSAGSLDIRANTVVFDGQLRADVVNGRLQRELADLARGGSLTIDTGFTDGNVQDVIFGNSRPEAFDYTLNSVLARDGNGVPLALAMQAGQLLASGVGEASFIGNGKVTVEAGSTLKLTDAGKLTLTGGQVDVLGNIQGSGASVALNTRVTNTPGLDGDITVADGAQILLQGQWVNDFARQANLDDKTLIINGGIFSARMGGSEGGQLNLARGSRVDVSGGAWLKADGNLQAGAAGEISVVAEPGVDNVAANVFLNGVLEAYGIDKGGKFTARANGVAIRREEIVNTAPGVQPLQISTGFFGRGGFAEFDISANLNGLSVAEGAVINLAQQNRVLGNGFLTGSNADSIAGISTLTVLDPLLRAPSSLTLRADHTAGSNLDSHLIIERGAAIVADQQSDIHLVSDSSLIMDGHITAHGGTVGMEIVPDLSPNDPTYLASQGIWLGESAAIDVSGGSEIMTDGLGRRFGEVYAGGSFTVDAKRGFFAAQVGSSINVSGTQDVLHIPTATGQGVMYTAQTVGSHAGTVDISAAEGIFLDGQMSAKGGNAAGTAGGTLQLALNINNRRDPNIETGSTFPSAARTFQVTQQQTPTLTDSFSEAGDALPNGLAGSGHIAADQVMNSGFDTLNLATSGAFVTVNDGGTPKKVQVGNDAIVFKGDVNLSLRNALALDSANLAWQRSDAADTGVVNLQATTATLGSDNFRQSWLNPSGGDGQLTVRADLIDLVGGSATQGFDAVHLAADGDIRLKGIRLDSRETDFVGEFKTYSQLELSADQIYPTTLTDFTLAVSGDVDGTLTVNPGDKPMPVLSALGKMTLQAPNIVQNGTLSAPQGEIVLDAAQEVSFGADSLTTVSAAGTLVPLGETQAGLEWLFPLAGTGANLNVNDATLNAPATDRAIIIHSPEKKITVDAARITREEGATVDLSGGGDMLSFEFVPGDGGSQDVLAGSGSFAILPGSGGYAPFDPKLSPESGLKTGDSLYLSGIPGLAAGTYTLLPARYALLPGAFLVTPLATTNVVAGGSRDRVDGAPIVSGYRTVAGTSIRDQRWSEYVIEPGSIAKTRSEYNLRLASEFFATQATNNGNSMPRLAQDAGQLVLSAVNALDLPTVIAEVTGSGRGGLVDIVANKLAVVGEKTGAAGVVELLSSDIDKFKVDSLALGAVRRIDNATGEVALDVRANTVTVGRDTQVSAPELLMAATDKVELKENARVTARGQVAEGANQTVLKVQGDGALLRASAGKQAQLVRTGSTGVKGDLLIEAGALVDAGAGSLLLDASRKNSLLGELALDGGSLNLGAEVINLGETAGLVNGLSLDNRQLSALTVAELVLTSRGMVNLYGQLAQVDANAQVLTDGNGDPLALQFGNLVIDADGLAGFANAGKTAALQADSVRFTNGGSVDSAQGGGSGNLLLNAGKLTFDKGQYALSGFDAMQIKAAQGVFGRDTASVDVAGDLNLSTPFFTAFNGASTTLNAGGHALTLANMDGAAAPTPGIAGALRVEADTLTVDTALLYKTGAVGLSALQGDLTLGDHALVDVSGAVVQAGLSQARNLDAGSITLLAKQQDVVAENGSRLLLNAVNDKAKAGVLTAKAGAGEVRLNGSLAAGGGSKSQGGSAVIDSGNLTGGFDALNQQLVAGGFTGSIDVRLRSGDIMLSNGQTVAAHSIKLTADSGAITLAGTLDASDAEGGSVELNAEDNLMLAATANILANAAGTDQAGGKVVLASLDSQNDGAGIVLSDGARIDVSASGAGEEGQVHLRAGRTGNDIAVGAITDGTISGASRVDLEAVRVYNDTVITTADQNNYDSDNRNFIDNFNDRFGAGYALLAGVEVRSNGDLTVADSWDLSGWRYGADNLPGSLVLRAGGNLLMNAGLSDGFSAGTLDTLANGSFGVTDMLRTDQSWSYRLVAGADVSSADSSALKPAPSLLQAASDGDFKLADDTSVRSGTGDIEVFAARDIVYGNAASTIYSAGRADTVNRYGSGGEDLAIFFYAEFARDGGDINLAAGRDVIAQPTDQLLSDALVRTGNWSRNQDHSGERPTIWGLALGTAENGMEPRQHRQSLAAFGGGDISVRAGGKVTDVSVAIPTTGKQVGERTNPSVADDFNFNTNVNQVQGGGNLTVNAGGDIEGGVFYVDGGQADLRTAGSLTAGNNQGLNPILALGDAQFSVTAGKDIALEAIVDPLFATLPDSVDLEGFQNRFFRYSANSAVTLTALTGDIVLDNDPVSLNQATNVSLDTTRMLIYPSTFKAYALNGDLSIQKSFSLFPAPKGGLELFADGRIGGNANVLLSDAEVASLPSAQFPVQQTAVVDVLNFLDPTQDNQSHALNPVHADDDQPVLISTGSGNIGGGNDILSFTLAKAAEIRSGQDVFNTTIKIQNNRPDDVSVISAARDIRFPVTRNLQTAAINLGDQVIEIAGPGDLVALAGRNIDMGASKGILSVGDLDNPVLEDQGANITALASMGDGRIDVNAFAERVLKQTDAQTGQPVAAYLQYRERFIQEIRRVSGNDALLDADADAAFAALNQVDRARVEAKLLPSVQTKFLENVKDAAVDSAIATAKFKGATRPDDKVAFKTEADQAEMKLLAMIETLFPGTTLLDGVAGITVNPDGGVSLPEGRSAGEILDAVNAAGRDRPVLGGVALFMSTAQTQDGGNVNVFTPNGGVNVGLAIADIGLNPVPQPDQLGLITKKRGNINVLVRDDIEVNVQRIFAVEGDVLAGSSEGDVDAGRSAITALAAPSLKVSFDQSGLPLLEVAPVFAGGGIRAPSGIGTLFALRGTINAGEAGVGARGLFIATPVLQNGQNVDVGSGGSVGVPTAATGSIAAGLGSVSNVAAAVSKSLDESTNLGKNANDMLSKSAALGLLSIDLLGFGE